MTPRQLYVERILPALETFLVGYISRDVGLFQDTARGAAVAQLLQSLPEYLFEEVNRPRKLQSFRSAREYRENCWSAEPRYELTCDFANAWKHRKINRDGRQLVGMTSVTESFAICRYRDEQGPYYRTIKLVMVRAEDGQELDLRRMLVSSCRFWGRELSDIGVTPETAIERFAFDEDIDRRDQHYLQPLNLHGYVGESLAIQGRAFDFDYRERQLVYADPAAGFDGKSRINTIVHPSPFSR